jgi:hypothetical protein
MNAPEPSRPEPPATPWGRRYLRVFLAIVGLAALLAAGLNLLGFSLMTRPDHAVLAQFAYTWGRTTRPLLHDRLRPEIVVFGASWARDAFDPEDLSALTGAPAVNHAVSGGLPYENRRFLQSALAGNPNLKTVILNADSFILRPHALRSQHTFDEALLRVDADGAPNPYFGLRRAYTLTLSGAAVGANLEFLGMLRRLRAGETKEQVVVAYQQRDFARRPARRPPTPLSAAEIDEAVARAAAPPDPRPFAELSLALDAAAARGVAAFVYFNPSLVDVGSTTSVGEKLALLAFLAERAKRSPTPLKLLDFHYPNAVTLENRANPGLSRYFRPDGHPRPTVGALMAARFFDKPLPDGAPPELQADFGVDLLAHPDAAAWLVRQARRQAELQAERP